MGLIAKRPPENRQPSDSSIRKGTVVLAIAGGIIGAWVAALNEFSPLGVILSSLAIAAVFAGISIKANSW